MSAAASIFLVPHIAEEEDPTPIISAETAALLDEMDEWDKLSVFEKNRQLGASPHLRVDLSDADTLWTPHTCVSDDSGACPTCAAYLAAGGVL